LVVEAQTSGCVDNALNIVVVPARLTPTMMKLGSAARVNRHAPGFGIDRLVLWQGESMSAAEAAGTAAGVVVVIPALDEERRIGDTVLSAAGLPDVVAVVVTDDGSIDATGQVARSARRPR
jgi:hypothetical protein